MKLFAFQFLILVIGVSGAPTDDNFGSTIILIDKGPLGLNLRKTETTTFHEDFRVLLAKVDKSGQLEFVDKTPHHAEIRSIENRIHVDNEAQAVVTLDVVDEKPQLFGIIGDKMVSFHEGSGLHIVDAGDDSAAQVDYVEIPTPGPVEYVNRSINADVSVEIVLVVDNLLYQKFGGNVAQISEYYAIFVRSMNIRYATSSNPTVSIKITGIVLMENAASQPFIENHRQPDGSYDHNAILPSFSDYMASNSASLPPHDVGALVTNVDFTGSVAGLAYVKAACNPRFKYSINMESGVFRGIGIVTHELGHNLGTYHDGDAANGGGDCPNDDGYIMSTYGGKDENSFYFSTCSKNAMNDYFGTTAANCLYSNEAPVSWTPSPFLPGDRVEMLDFCLDYRPDAYVSVTATPDELCKNVKCSFRDTCPPPNEHLMCTWTATLNTPAPDGASCGSGGKCSLGWCR